MTTGGSTNAIIIVLNWVGLKQRLFHVFNKKSGIVLVHVNYHSNSFDLGKVSTVEGEVVQKVHQMNDCWTSAQGRSKEVSDHPDVWGGDVKRFYVHGKNVSWDMDI